jgi:hypothetical protein
VCVFAHSTDHTWAICNFHPALSSAFVFLADAVICIASPRLALLCRTFALLKVALSCLALPPPPLNTSHMYCTCTNTRIHISRQSNKSTKYSLQYLPTPTYPIPTRRAQPDRDPTSPTQAIFLASRMPFSVWQRHQEGGDPVLRKVPSTWHYTLALAYY